MPLCLLKMQIKRKEITQQKLLNCLQLPAMINNFEGVHYIPILIHLLGAISSCAQASKSESGCPVCLFLMWPRKDFHLANISFSNPSRVGCNISLTI